MWRLRTQLRAAGLQEARRGSPLLPPEAKERVMRRVRLTQRRHVDLLLTASALCPR
jgi:hypothetical protein